MNSIEGLRDKTSEQVQRGGKAGAGIEDVAREAGVSTATVSRAVRDLPRVSPATREKVLKVARELGYVASSSAAGLATGRTRTVGVLAPSMDRWFFTKAIEGVDRELHARGYSLSLLNLSGQRGARRPFSKTVLFKQIDALLVLSMSLRSEEIADLQEIGIPWMVVGGQVDGCPCIGIDNYFASVDATMHLLNLGHREIALLHGDDTSNLNFTVRGEHVDGFTHAITNAGISMPPEWAIPGNFTVGSGQKAFNELWDKPGRKPTAIFCAADEMAMGVMLQALRSGVRVPEDLSIVGIDNHDFSKAMGLTTVAQDPVEQGQLGTRMLLDELAGAADSVRSMKAAHRLIARETTTSLHAREAVPGVWQAAPVNRGGSSATAAARFFQS